MTSNLIPCLDASLTALGELADVTGTELEIRNWTFVFGSQCATLDCGLIQLFWSPQSDPPTTDIKRSASRIARAIGTDWTVDESGSWWGSLGPYVKLVLHCVEPRSPISRKPVTLVSPL